MPCILGYPGKLSTHRLPNGCQGTICHPTLFIQMLPSQIRNWGLYLTAEFTAKLFVSNNIKTIKYFTSLFI